jgi:hypothetical protein
MNRGEFVTIAIQGDFGKPRTALVMAKSSRLASGGALQNLRPLGEHHSPGK